MHIFMSGKLKVVLKQLVVLTTSMARSLSTGEVQTLLKLNSRPQHPLSGRDVTLVTEREGWGLIKKFKGASNAPLTSYHLSH